MLHTTHFMCDEDWKKIKLDEPRRLDTETQTIPSSGQIMQGYDLTYSRFKKETLISLGSQHI